MEKDYNERFHTAFYSKQLLFINITLLRKHTRSLCITNMQ